MSNQDWLNPLNKSIWMKAFKAKAKSVTIRDGRKFNIEYTKRIIYKGEGLVDIAIVKPVKWGGPSGWFRMNRVTDSNWLTESDRAATPAKESPYDKMLTQFVTSGEAGVNVMEKWPELRDKSPSSLRASFKIRIDKRREKVKVVNSDGKVFLIKD